MDNICQLVPCAGAVLFLKQFFCLSSLCLQRTIIFPPSINFPKLHETIFPPKYDLLSFISSFNDIRLKNTYVLLSREINCRKIHPWSLFFVCQFVCFLLLFIRTSRKGQGVNGCTSVLEKEQEEKGTDLQLQNRFIALVEDKGRRQGKKTLYLYIYIYIQIYLSIYLYIYVSMMLQGSIRANQA